jgi:hypothetical protein
MKPVLARCPLKALHCPAKLHPGLSKPLRKEIIELTQQDSILLTILGCI